MFPFFTGVSLSVYSQRYMSLVYSNRLSIARLSLMSTCLMLDSKPCQLYVPRLPNKVPITFQTLTPIQIVLSLILLHRLYTKMTEAIRVWRFHLARGYIFCCTLWLIDSPSQHSLCANDFSLTSLNSSRSLSNRYSKCFEQAFSFMVVIVTSNNIHM